MAQFKLVAKRGIDPLDGNDTYCAALYDEQGVLVGGYATDADEGSDNLFSSWQMFVTALGLGLVQVSMFDPNGHKFVESLAGSPVLWETEVEGELNMEEDEPGELEA